MSIDRVNISNPGIFKPDRRIPDRGAMPRDATNGFAGRCLHDVRPGKGKKWQKRS